MSDQDAEQLLFRIRLNGWLRQNRLRAKRYGCVVDLSFDQLTEVYSAFKNRCLYCGDVSDIPDVAFPIRDKAPLVPANIIPCCEKCRIKKKGHSIINYYKRGCIDKDKLRIILSGMIERLGGKLIREHMRQVIL